MRNRQYRRTKREHHFNRAKSFLKSTWLKFSSDQEIEQKALRFSRTRAVCSCWMCGNQRRWHGATRSEKIAPKVCDWD